MIKTAISVQTHSSWQLYRRTKSCNLIGPFAIPKGKGVCDKKFCLGSFAGGGGGGGGGGGRLGTSGHGDVWARDYTAPAHIYIASFPISTHSFFVLHAKKS